MKVIVLIKQILDPAGITIRRDKERVFINREDYILDPGSRAALEAALRVKDSREGEAEVVALSLGPPRAEEALREALAMGSDAAVLLCDPAFESADAAVAARLLAAAIRKLGKADLVLAGQEASDTGSGQIGPRVAEVLDYPQVTSACALEVEQGAIQATRAWRNGFATLSLPLPAVVTVAPGAFPARYPHGARIISAYREGEVPVWGAAELGLEENGLAPLLAFRGESFPPPLPTGELLRGNPTDLAQELVAVLRQHRVIP